ncbi:MAG: prepilin-type N-terminal cleavage/methylation domain-containing protein [Alphaproteobacteria bacterium]|nr:prepilin-type N-terminal cleavage/methylation domain-containing protein [Alphaproteobacteria bacterium]MCH1542608.1 prepilin-type N-terminal cleavage/methylation domain-containing protein [Alphaproteobacteria bacterium]
MSISLSSRGFSLIELLVVIAIIGILAAVGIVGYQVILRRRKTKRRKPIKTSFRAPFSKTICL